MDSLKEYIAFYQSLGFAILPAFYGQKRPSVEWRMFQQKKLTKQQVAAWFEEGKHNNAVQRSGFCAACKRVGSPYISKTATRGGRGRIAILVHPDSSFAL